MPIHNSSQSSSHLVGFLLVALLSIIGSGEASAAICRVTADAAGGGDGQDWLNSPMTLHEALGSASCTEVWVKAGVYITGTQFADHFDIGPDLAVYGGFAGTETAREQRDAALNVTVLSGDVGNDDINIDGNGIAETRAHIVGLNGKNVVFLYALTGAPITETTVVDGFTITAGGNNPAADSTAFGGGLLCAASGLGAECNAIISNVTFSGNSARGGGALSVIALNGGTSSPTIFNVTFSSNTGRYGGALYVDVQNTGGTSNPTLYNVTFSDNYGDQSSGGTSEGGAMYVGDGANPTLYHVTFSGNSAERGGAIFNGSVDLALHDAILWGNTATFSDPQIYNQPGAGAQTMIDHSVVQDAFQGGVWDASLGIDAGGNTEADPELGVLADHGGSTATILLGAGSSAIDAGSNRCLSQSILSLDQRGMARPQGPQCDIGAVEVPYPVALTVGSVSGSGSVSAAATPAPLTGSIADCDGSGGGSCSAEYAQETVVQITATPAPQWLFVGWGGDCSGTGIHFNVLMDAPKSCNAEFAIDANAALVVAVDDARAYAQVGDWLTYAISVNNYSAADVNAVGISDVLPAQLQTASAIWQCIPSQGATCTASGSGDVTDTVNLPAQSSVVYVLSAQVLGGAGDTVENMVGVTGASGTITASDTTTLVIFRNGFDGGDGAQ